jgi:hypothetical protein
VLTIIIIIIIIIIIGMALKPFVGPLPLFQFLRPIYTVVRIPWMGISPSKDLYLHAEQDNTK